jgi:hypothetical protein
LQRTHDAVADAVDIGITATVAVSAGAVLIDGADDRAAPVAQALLARSAAPLDPLPRASSLGLGGIRPPQSAKTETEAGEPTQNVAASWNATQGVNQGIKAMLVQGHSPRHYQSGVGGRRMSADIATVPLRR